MTSAASAAALPIGGRPAIALIGRSNVGKSSLINALVRQRIARTSAAPGKTRLANLYRVARSGAAPMYLVDLPGYGYARKGPDGPGDFGPLAAAVVGRTAATLLLVDARHPGLDSDRAAAAWVLARAEASAIVATKIDKLARGRRSRALAELESVFEGPVLPVSAATGEGLDELWILIDRLANSSRPPAAAPPRRPPRKR
ncbi:MAG: ribosome biogenesis GTP-binding protein YihA/YsxC [Betaproteobacteria bacterium]